MESFNEKISRVKLMASGSDTWDLSDNDLAALNEVLSQLQMANDLIAHNRAALATAEARLAESEALIAGLRAEVEQAKDVISSTLDHLLAVEAQSAEYLAHLGIMTPPHIHGGASDSWEIYTAFTSGGGIHRYTVDQARRAKDAVFNATPSDALAADRQRVRSEALREAANELIRMVVEDDDGGNFDDAARVLRNIAEYGSNI